MASNAVNSHLEPGDLTIQAKRRFHVYVTKGFNQLVAILIVIHVHAVPQKIGFYECPLT